MADTPPDPTRVYRLLWRESDVASARTGLHVGKVVDAGFELVGEHGLAALSMRKVAERLGVGVMTLYGYVASRDELIALLVERAMGDLEVVPVDGTWRSRLERLARCYWNHYQRYPWLLDVPVARPVLGPNAFDRYEAELAIVDGIGLDDLEMNAAIEVLHAHVEGVARRGFEARADAVRSDLTDDEWWGLVEPVLEELLVDRFYPVSSRVGAAVAAPHTDPMYLFDFGVAAILDGIERRLEARAAEDDRPS